MGLGGCSGLLLSPMRFLLLLLISDMLAGDSVGEAISRVRMGDTRH